MNNLNVDVLNKMPLRDVVYLCLTNIADLTDSGMGLPSDEVRFDLDYADVCCCPNVAAYGLTNVNSWLRLCDDSEDDSHETDAMFTRLDFVHRNGEYVFYKAWFPSFDKYEPNGRLQEISEVMTTEEASAFMESLLVEKRQKIRKELFGISKAMSGGLLVCPVGEMAA